VFVTNLPQMPYSMNLTEISGIPVSSQGGTLITSIEGDVPTVIVGPLDNYGNVNVNHSSLGGLPVSTSNGV
jgi:hypothetical protein